MNKPWVTLLLSLVVGISSAEGETVTYYYANQQGTPLATADAAGSLLSSAEYKPYGEQVLGVPMSGPAYTGHVVDPDSGLIYMQARYYDPVVGRFLTTDPVDSAPGAPVTFNRYAYAGDNPVVNTDPDGRQCAQCLYFPAGDLEKQARINQGAAGKSLTVVLIAASVAGSVVQPELAAEAVPLAETLEAGGVEAEVAAGAEVEAEAASGEVASDEAASSETAFPDRELPRDPRTGEPVKDPEANGPHSQLGKGTGRKVGKYDQAREFDQDGKAVRDVHFTDHGRPRVHTSPHQHRYLPNPTGGTPQVGPAEPLPPEPQVPPLL
jgi:RHS repeat-associated protein